MGEHLLCRGHLHRGRETRSGDGGPRRVRGPWHAGLRGMAEDRGKRSSGNVDRCGRSILEARRMTAREVVELIEKNGGAPFNERSYRDTFKLGNPDATVTGIATTVMATFDMLKRAQAAGLNMVISHEDTFWNDRDDVQELAENPLYKLKTEFVLKNGMIVWRDHDHMHAMKPDFTVVGSLRSVGVKGGENAVMAPRIYTIPETSLGELAAQVKRLTGSRAFRCAGDPKARGS